MAAELLLGLAVGAAGGVLVKDKIMGSNSSQEMQKNQSEMDNLLNENDKLRTRNKEAERQIEDLLAEIQKLRRQSKENDDSKDDLEDDLDDAKKEIKKLKLQNDELTRKIQEYKTACDNYEIEVQRLKNK